MVLRKYAKMKYYLYTLSIYAVCSSGLILFLIKQNTSLKERLTVKNNTEIVNYRKKHEIEIKNAPMQGSVDAPITIIEFSDFECPACAQGAMGVQRLMKKYPGKIRIFFKHHPLPYHKQALSAAKAAMAAHVQGKFWEMHDFLFQLKGQLYEDTYDMAARRIGLNSTQFSSDFQMVEWNDFIDNDLQEGGSLGITSVPTFFVNGVKVSTMDFKVLEKLMVSILEDQGLAGQKKNEPQ